MPNMNDSAPNQSNDQRAVLYARVSTDKQAADGHGLDAQRTRLQSYAQSQGLDVIDFVVDEGVSAKALERDGMARIRELVDSGAVDVVLVTKADRVSRSLRDLLNFSAELEDHGITLITTDEQLDTSSPLGRAMNAMRGVFAQLERELVSVRTREAMAAAKDKGVRLGRPPVGWAIENGRWVRTLRFPVVQRAHELRNEGLTLQQVADRLNNENAPTGSGRGRWYPSNVSRLLKSPLLPPA